MDTETIKNKTHFIFPRTLLLQIDKVAGKRKRSAFVVQATKGELARMRFESALNQAAGAWSDKKYANFSKKSDVEKYLRTLRKSWDKRLKRVYA